MNKVSLNLISFSNSSQRLRVAIFQLFLPVIITFLIIEVLDFFVSDVYNGYKVVITGLICGIDLGIFLGFTGYHSNTKLWVFDDRIEVYLKGINSIDKHLFKEDFTIEIIKRKESEVTAVTYCIVMTQSGNDRLELIVASRYFKSAKRRVLEFIDQVKPVNSKIYEELRNAYSMSNLKY